MKILRTADVVALTRLSRTTLWRYVKDGRFPRQITLGPGSVGWIESEIEEWVRERQAERDRTPAA